MKFLQGLVLLFGMAVCAPSSYALTKTITWDQGYDFGKIPVGESREIDLVLDRLMFTRIIRSPSSRWPVGTLYSRVYAIITNYDLGDPPVAFNITKSTSFNFVFHVKVTSLLSDVGNGSTISYVQNYYNMYEDGYDRFGKPTGLIDANDYFQSGKFVQYTAVGISSVPLLPTIAFLASALLALGINGVRHNARKLA